ncbi:MAG TPA: hypothetical protein VG889_17310 [Rhizomicrobium sp.]|nr:hypothetical protein [Rhizomicrobium sp.]
MTGNFIVALLEVLTETLTRLAPLVAQGRAVIGATDAASVHDALAKAEAATASLRSEVDAALAEAAKQ